MTTLRVSQIRTTDYSATPNEAVLVDASASSVAITLPLRPLDGTQQSITKLDATPNTARIVTPGCGISSTDGTSPPTSLTSQNQTLVVHYSATARTWLVDPAEAAGLSVGTTPGTVAAGDDSRIVGALPAATAATTYAPIAEPLAVKVAGDVGGTPAAPVIAKINGVPVSGGSGAPDALAGSLGQWYFRSDTPGVAGQNIYRCTTAGTAGNATWGALL